MVGPTLALAPGRLVDGLFFQGGFGLAGLPWSPFFEYTLSTHIDVIHGVHWCIQLNYNASKGPKSSDTIIIGPGRPSKTL